jgi:hypothetical protein
VKKALVPLLMVVIAAYAPPLWSTAEFRWRVAEIPSTVASPLFWHLWDELVACELGQANSDAKQLAEQVECRRDSAAGLLFQVLFKQAVEEFSCSSCEAGCTNAPAISSEEIPVLR